MLDSQITTLFARVLAAALDVLRGDSGRVMLSPLTHALFASGFDVDQSKSLSLLNLLRECAIYGARAAVAYATG